MIHYFQKMRIFQSSSNPLLICQLFIYCGFRCMCSRSYRHINLWAIRIDIFNVEFLVIIYFCRVKIYLLNNIHTLNLGGKDRSNFTLIDNPMSVAMLQWGIVGVNTTLTLLCSSSTDTSCSFTTSNCSSVRGCSGSFMSLKLGYQKNHKFLAIYYSSIIC